MASQRKTSSPPETTAAPASTGDAVLISPKRAHLDGLAYYVVYLPAMFVAACCALLFVAAVERYVYGGVD